eukprot:PITA_09317
MRIFFCCFILCVSNPVVSTFQLSNHPHPHPHLSNASDQEALLAFMSAITYDPFQLLSTTWKPNVSFCNWAGVTCSLRRQRVVSVNVSNMGLQGTISPFLSNLSFLRILDLRNNKFHGHIPYQLGSLFRLKMLRMSLNQLGGSIPPALCGCRNLQNFSVAYNNLTAKIPTQLCVLPRLQHINLYVNNLTGTIPACLGNISTLHYIDLGNNNLHGFVPPELGMLSQVRVISLSHNNLRGQIPSSLSNCTSLQQLDVTQNQFTGHIPVDFCSKNTGLWGFYLGGNQLSGIIPSSLFNCTKLQRVSLAENELSGLVPNEFGKLKQLQSLTLSKNQLFSSSTTGLSILTALTNCSTLRKIDFSINHLRGRLPSSVGQLSTKLQLMDLGTNGLVGEIPLQIGNLTGLTLLALDHNSFTGTVPSSLKMLQKMERLYMGGNYLQGNLPVQIGQLRSLGLLAMEENNLSGKIPDSIANLWQLRYLYLQKNQLSGKIPKDLGKCVNLLLLDLSYNKLSGDIPPEVGSLANLAFYFNISNNLLEGPLPLEITKMTMLQAIDISVNQLSGYIPSGFGSCRELEYINLSYNALAGQIPTSLGELQSLEVLDFASNNLSGGIPMSLANLKMLKELNLSFNNLAGEVPKGGVFKKLGSKAFMGNPGLCGPWVSLSPCSTSKHKGVSNLKRVIIPIVVVTIIGVSCLFFIFLWRRNHKRHIPMEVGASLNVGHPRISYGELISATEEFSDDNLLGVGSFGKVYKGVLNDGTMIAVKLLNLENERAHRSFDRECKVLGRVRHRNLIRIITSYSDHQIKALIFPLMPNGSLEKWLYPDGEVESCLNLIQRLDIAIDIAQGMSYLHHHCFMQVIHCDLKPKNVLLGEDMTAYIIDFGIATICSANFEDLALTSTHTLKGSTGYIPPEYGLAGHVTTKGDVYSYGVVLLEMLTRKKPTHNMFVEGMTLQKWVSSSFPNRVWEVVDKSLLRRTNTIIEEEKELNCLNYLVRVGLLCTTESPEGRPTMMDIVNTLQDIREFFLGTRGIPKFPSNISHLLASTSTTHNNNFEDQSSSTF